METNASRPYQDFNGSYSDDVNSYISGVVSLVFNALLIYSTSQIRSYTKSVRFSMYSISILRLVFSISIILTSPVIIYSKSVNYLYIIKNGVSFPTPVGDFFLSLFVAFIVMSCNGPAVQYLQVANLLSSSTRKETSFSISLIPLLVVTSSLFLIFFGYIPPFYDIHISKYLLELIAEQGDTAFLIVTVRLVLSLQKMKRNTERVASSLQTFDENDTFQLLSQTCTLFILVVMFSSILTVVVCYFYIRKQMEIRFAVSSNSLKSQEQLNTVLLLQFILPFITIHIPFYIIVILPFFGLTAKIVADRVLYLFSWCPAINPILVILVVKNIRDQLVPRRFAHKDSAANRNNSIGASKFRIVSL